MVQPKTSPGSVARTGSLRAKSFIGILKGGRMGIIRQKVVDIIPTTSLRTTPKLMISDRERRCEGPDLDPLHNDILATTLMRSNFMRRAARAVMSAQSEDVKTTEHRMIAQCRAQLAQQQVKIDSFISISGTGSFVSRSLSRTLLGTV